MRLVVAMYAVSIALAQSQPGSLRTYQDPQNRFQFTYPAEFSTPEPGTDNGFRDRTASIRFAEFSAGVDGRVIILGGECLVTRGGPAGGFQTAALSVGT